MQPTFTHTQEYSRNILPRIISVMVTTLKRKNLLPDGDVIMRKKEITSIANIIPYAQPY